MINVISATLLTMEQYKANSNVIPSICGGYWLKTSVDNAGEEAHMRYIWSDMTSTIEGASAVTCEADIRLVLTASGLELEPRDEEGFVKFGGCRWMPIDEDHMVSEKTFGRMRFCEKAKGMASYETSDIKGFVDGVIMPELLRKEQEGGELDTNFYHLAKVYSDNLKSFNQPSGFGSFNDMSFNMAS